MSHHIYQTDAIILEVRNVGERNKIVWVFTRDIGLIIATVQGVRDMKSKLRYALNEFSRIKVSLVRGKEIWRLVNAEARENYFFLLRERQIAVRLIARLCVLLRRLLTGEEAHPELFEIVEGGLSYLVAHEGEEDALERIMVLRILNRLGYVADKNVEFFLTGYEVTPELIVASETHRKLMIETINKALKESQL